MNPPFQGCAEIFAYIYSNSDRAKIKARSVANRLGRTVYVDYLPENDLLKVCWVVWVQVPNFESPQIEGAIRRQDLRYFPEKRMQTLVDPKSKKG